jgi:hypothetical protein
MITLKAEITVKGENATPFVLGSSRLGYANFGEIVDRVELIDKRVMLSLDCETRDRSDIEKPSFGVISNGGSLSFNDGYSRFLNLINSGFLSGGEEIKIFLENTITKQRRQVGVYYAEDWDFDNDSKSISVKIRDDLEEWQEIDCPALNYDIENGSDSSMKDIYDFLFRNTPSKYNMLPFKQLDDETRQFISKSTIGIPLIYSSNLWNQWQKFCDSCCTQIYKNKDGNTVCKYMGGQ